MQECHSWHGHRRPQCRAVCVAGPLGYPGGREGLALCHTSARRWHWGLPSVFSLFCEGNHLSFTTKNENSCLSYGFQEECMSLGFTSPSKPVFRCNSSGSYKQVTNYVLFAEPMYFDSHGLTPSEWSASGKSQKFKIFLVFNILDYPAQM